MVQYLLIWRYNMATYNGLYIAKNDMRRRQSYLVLPVPKGTSVEVQKGGILLGHTVANSLISALDTATPTTDPANLKFGTTDATLDLTVVKASKPIIFRDAAASAALAVDKVFVVEMLELDNTTGYIQGREVTRQPVDETGAQCIELPDSGKRAF